MSTLQSLLEGRKTHLLVLVYVLFLVITNQPTEGDAIIGNLDPAAIKEALLAAMISSGKAAFDRWTKQ